MDGWGKIGVATKYAGVGPDTFETFVKSGLRFVRTPGGTRLFKKEWVDSFLESLEDSKAENLQKIADDILKDL
jgi:excisionase family DNA binding protein